MHLKKYTIRGVDAFGKPVTEEIKVAHYTIFERIWRRLFRRRLKVISGIRIVGLDAVEKP